MWKFDLHLYLILPPYLGPYTPAVLLAKSRRGKLEDVDTSILVYAIGGGFTRCLWDVRNISNKMF